MVLGGSSALGAGVEGAGDACELLDLERPAWRGVERQPVLDLSRCEWRDLKGLLDISIARRKAASERQSGISDHPGFLEWQSSLGQKLRQAMNDVYYCILTH